MTEEDMSLVEDLRGLKLEGQQGVIIENAIERISVTKPDLEAMLHALKVGDAFCNACFSAWSCGEPAHRVRIMLDSADEFRAALNALPEIPTDPYYQPGAFKNAAAARLRYMCVHGSIDSAYGEYPHPVVTMIDDVRKFLRDSDTQPKAGDSEAAPLGSGADPKGIARD